MHLIKLLVVLCFTNLLFSFSTNIEDYSINSVLGSGGHTVFLQCVMNPVDPFKPLVVRQELILYRKKLACNQMANGELTKFLPGDEILLRQSVSKNLNHELINHYFSPTPVTSFDSSAGYDPMAPSLNGKGLKIQVVDGAIAFTPFESPSMKEPFSLKAGQKFLGSIGPKIFYSDNKEPTELYFYNVDNPKMHFVLKLQSTGIITRWEPWNYLVVLGGSSTNTIWVLVKYKKKHGFGSPYWIKFVEINTVSAKQVK